MPVSGEELRVLAEEQAALRRVATLVARGVPPDEVFAAVTVEVVRLLPVDFARMGRYESDSTVTTVAASGRADDHFPVGPRLAPGWKNLGRMVAQTGRSARVDSVADASALGGVTAQRTGARSAVGTGHRVSLQCSTSIVCRPVARHHCQRPRSLGAGRRPRIAASR
jgi:GAF domain-containing protein